MYIYIVNYAQPRLVDGCAIYETRERHFQEGDRSEVAQQIKAFLEQGEVQSSNGVRHARSLIGILRHQPSHSEPVDIADLSGVGFI
jgi:hypothetical protein